MATLSTVILTEAEPIKQTTQQDRAKFIDGRIFVFNVKSIDSTGSVTPNTGNLAGKFLGQGAGVWDDFQDVYPLDGSMGGGWFCDYANRMLPTHIKFRDF